MVITMNTSSSANLVSTTKGSSAQLSLVIWLPFRSGWQQTGNPNVIGQELIKFACTQNVLDEMLAGKGGRGGGGGGGGGNRGP